MIFQQQIQVKTNGRGTQNITSDIVSVIQKSSINTGLCHVFIQHTSASLIITENADPDVRRDLEYYFSKHVQDGDPNYHHNMEGDDDMAAHIRTVLTQTEITIPLISGNLGLGVWQGLFLWEHRNHPHRRTITITLSGE